MKFKPLEKKEVTFEFLFEPSHITLRGNAQVSGNEELDRETEDELIARLNRGDEWAWFDVTCTASWGEHEGSTHLGACSYASEQDFYGDTQQIESLKAEALADLNENLRADLKYNEELQAALMARGE